MIVSNLKDAGYGESTRPFQLGRGLRDLGHSVLNVCDHEGSDGSDHRFTRKSTASFTSSWIWKKLDRLRLFIITRIFRPHIIYVHQVNNWVWARNSRTLPKALMVYDAHSSMVMEFRSFGINGDAIQKAMLSEQRAVHEPDLVITVSDETKKFITEELGVAPERVKVVKNATSLSPIAGLPDRAGRVGFTCSAILPQDGFQSNSMALNMLLDIAAALHNKDTSVKFRVVGGGEKPIPRSPNVIYTGYVQNLSEELATADVCLMPYPAEAVCGGVRNKVCDAFALALPVISTTEGMRGFDDAVPGAHHLLAEDIDGFCSAILRCKQDSELCSFLAQNALILSQSYQWPVRAKEVAGIFSKLVAEPK